MKMTVRMLCIAFFVLGLGLTASLAQKAKPTAAYKITKITILPFNEVTGQFEAEFTGDGSRAFWNDLSTSFLVEVQISGDPGSYEAARRVAITVNEGKKLKIQRTGYPGVLGTDGTYSVPVWLYGPMCNTIKINARITGQRTPSVMKREIPMACGE